MSELLRTARRSWDNQFDNPPIDMGIHNDVVWAISASPAVGVNGYAMVPAEGHPWSTGWPKDDDGWYVDDIIDVHGGVTYRQFPWLGFDTVHAWDIWPDEYNPGGVRMGFAGHPDWNIKWTVEKVIDEVKKLAAQIAQIGANADG